MGKCKENCGCGRHTVSVGWREKQRASHLGRTFSEESIEKMRQAQARRGPRSEETKRRNSEASRRNWENPEYRRNMLEVCIPALHTSEMNQRQSQAMEGCVPWNKGRTGVYTEEVLQRISETVRQGWMEGKYTASCQSPNKSEQQLGVILKGYGFSFVGNRQLLVGGKCPDFWDGGTKLVELYGDHWHRGQNPQDRIEFFARYGYGCLVIWESELLKTKEMVEASIKAFMEV